MADRRTPFWRPGGRWLHRARSSRPPRRRCTHETAIAVIDSVSYQPPILPTPLPDVGSPALLILVANSPACGCGAPAGHQQGPDRGRHRVARTFRGDLACPIPDSPPVSLLVLWAWLVGTLDRNAAARRSHTKRRRGRLPDPSL